MAGINKTQDRRKRLAKITALVIVLAMLAGSFFYVLMLLASAFGWDAPGMVYAAELSDKELQDSRLENLDAVINYLQNNYNGGITRDELIRGVYQGLFDALGDRWSEYYFVEDNVPSLAVQLDNSYYGVGITMQAEGGRILVTDVNRKGTAFAAGVRAGWYLIGIDGENISGMGISEVAMKVRGAEGTKVLLTFDADGRTVSVTLDRVPLVNATVFGEMLAGNTGYIEISSFSSNTAEEFAEVRADLMAQGMDSLIIDLRDNGGGLLFQAIEIADQLIDEGVIALFYRQDRMVEYELSKPNSEPQLPMVVLINEYTASASECLAAALKENDVATIVGVTSYGKGLAQTTADVDNGDSLKLSVMEFRGPRNVVINGVGVIPDELVYRHGNMTSKEAAELLADMVPLSGERFYIGEYGLNVLAAQQRLKVLGYDVDFNGHMDNKTVAALKSIQKDAGSYQYGNLDSNTIRIISDRFTAWLNLDDTDPQLDRALEILK